MKAARNTKLGDWVVAFANRLTVPGGKLSGERLKLRPWQEKILRDIYEPFDRKTGKRIVSQCFLALPKKNGKTPIAAIVALLELVALCTPNGEVYSAATTRDQASLVFKYVSAMVKADPTLRAECTIVESRRRIVHTRSGSFYEALSADAASGRDGISPKCLIIDELHRFKKGKEVALYNLLKNSMGVADQSLTFTITTAGDDVSGICYAEWERARKCRDGIFDDPTYVPVIFEAPRNCNWQSEKVWAKVNPALGDFKTLESMRDMAREAKQKPSMLPEFKRFQLNIWTERSDAWLRMDRWDACPAIPGGLVSLEGHECYVGIDLSSRSDLTVMARVFPLEPDAKGLRRFVVVPTFWCPEENVTEMHGRTGAPYRSWVEQGHLKLTSGNVIDLDFIRAEVNAISKITPISKVGVDPWNALSLMTQLMGDGFDVLEFRQGYRSLSGPSKELENLVLDGRLIHGGHPVLRWNASNTVVDRDAAGNIKPTKEKRMGKIDGIVATIMGLALCLEAVGKPAEPAWDGRA